MASICKKSVTDDTVVFSFADGETITASLSGFSDDILTRLALHGLSQKMGDSYAGAESVIEARTLAQSVLDNLRNGLWAVKATRGGKIVEAIVRATGQNFETVLTKWAGMDDKEKAAIRKHPDVKKALAEIEAERAAKLAEAATDAAPLEF